MADVIVAAQPWWSSSSGMQHMTTSDSSTSLASDSHVEDDFMHQTWNPCTSSQMLVEYMDQEKNGPFLRSLFTQWQRLGSPSLNSIQELNSHEQAGETFDLHQLVQRQEQAIVQSIQMAMQFSFQLASSHKSFDTFAAQLGLFSSIKAELLTIEQSLPSSERGRKYHTVWQQHIQAFHQHRPTSCRASQKHLCLGTLVWGEAYSWPEKAMELAYRGYTFQLQAMQLLPDLIDELESSTDSITMPVLDAPSITATTSSSSASSNTTQATSPLANSELIRRLSKVSTRRRSSVGMLASSSDDWSFDILGSRRPTLIDFFDNGMTQLINMTSSPVLADASEAFIVQQPSAESTVVPTEGSSVSTIVGADQQHANVFDWDMLASGLPTSRSTDSSMSMATSMFFSPLPSDEQLSPFQQQQQHASPSHSLSPPLRSPTFSDRPAHPYAKRPAMRARSSTMNSALSSTLSAAAMTTEDSSESQSASTNVGMGRVRSRRHYARTKAQRTLIGDLLMKMATCVRTLWQEGQGGTRIAEGIQAALQYRLTDEARQLSVEDDESPTGQRTNQRKRESKQRIRLGDKQNVAILTRLAEMVIEVPVSRLSVLIASNEFASKEDKAVHMMLDVWLTFQHGWGDFVMAEKRFYAHSSQKIAVMVQLLQIAIGDKATM